MRYYGIVGTGGFGREVMPVARQMLNKEFGGTGYELVFIDENINRKTTVNGHRVIGMDEFFSLEADEKYFNIAIADYRNRERIASMILAKGIKPFTIQANNYLGLDSNFIDEGAIFCSFTHVTSNARIGKYFHCNIYSYVAHDCIIGDYVTFAPHVQCNGGVIVEDYVYIGTGAIIRQGTEDRPIVIGKGSIVGMGAVVTKSVRPFSTVVGNPAVEMAKRS